MGFEDARLRFYSSEPKSNKIEPKATGQLSVDFPLGRDSVFYIDASKLNAFSLRKLTKNGFGIDSSAFVSGISNDFLRLSNTGLAETGGCKHDQNFRIEISSGINITGIYTGATGIGGIPVPTPEGDFISSGANYWMADEENTHSFVTGRHNLLFYPRFDKSITKKYETTYTNCEIINNAKSEIYSCFGDIYQYSTGFLQQEGLTGEQFPPLYKEIMTGQSNLLKNYNLNIVSGHTGIKFDDSFSSVTRSTDCLRSGAKIILAPGYYSNTGTGVGYDENGLPSGSVSGEKITLTGFYGRRNKRSTFPVSGDGTPTITGFYFGGAYAIAEDSIFLPNLNDSGYGAKFTVQTQNDSYGSPKFFIASGDPPATSSEQTPAYKLHRGYEYLFDLTHVTNYENTMRFSYTNDGTWKHGEEITGWYELTVPGSTYSFNNYIEYNSPQEVALEVPVTGNSYAYEFSNSSTDANPGVGKASFYYGSNTQNITGVENILINNTNTESTIVTGWLDSLNNNGKYVRIFKEGDAETFASFYITDIEQASTYRKVGVTYTGHNNSLSDGDSIVVSPSGDGRVYYYSTVGTGYGGSGYFDITESGCGGC